MIPDDVRAAIAAALGSLLGIPGDPERPSFSEACETIRAWASDNLQDDPTEEQDPETGEWCEIHYDDEPWQSAQAKLRALVGPELFPHVR